MRGLGILLLWVASGLGAVHAEESASPLGNRARPGLPFPIRTTAPVELNGWRYAPDAAGTAWVTPLRLPVQVRRGDKALVRIEAVPAGSDWVGVIGALPEGWEARFSARTGRPLLAASLEAGSIPARWQALEHFDWVVVVRPLAELGSGAEVLRQWLLAGGRLAIRGDPSLSWPEGLGAFVAHPDPVELLQAAAALPDRRVPRPKIGTDDLRAALWTAPRVDAGTLNRCRPVLLAGLGAAALLVLLGARRGSGRRVTLASLVLVGSVVVGMTLWFGREYSAVAAGKIEIAWRKGDVQRVRTLEIRTALRGAREGDLPVDAQPLADPGEDPWWGTAGRLRLESGAWRVFVRDSIGGRMGPPDTEPRAVRFGQEFSLQTREAFPGLRLIRRGLTSTGRWEALPGRTLGAPSNAPDVVPVVCRLHLRAQD